MLGGQWSFPWGPVGKWIPKVDSGIKRGPVRESVQSFTFFCFWLSCQDTFPQLLSGSLENNDMFKRTGLVYKNVWESLYVVTCLYIVLGCSLLAFSSFDDYFMASSKMCGPYASANFRICITPLLAHIGSDISQENASGGFAPLHLKLWTDVRHRGPHKDFIYGHWITPLFPLFSPILLRCCSHPRRIDKAAYRRPQCALLTLNSPTLDITSSPIISPPCRCLVLLPLFNLIKVCLWCTEWEGF